MSYFIRWFVWILVLILSGCGTYHQSISQLPAENLKKIHSHYVPVKNGHIEYYRLGRGSPIILIPGYMTDVSSWNREFLAALAQQHQVIVLNNRNVGGSLIHSSHYESQDLANDTYQLIQTLNLKKPAVLGISMGGMIAQQLAVLHADKVGQLILINTAIAGKQAVHPNPLVEKKMLNIPQNKLGLYLTAIDLFFPSTWKMQMAYVLALNRFQPENYKEINFKNVTSQQQHLLMHWVSDNTTANKIKKLTLPVLILNGEEDAVIPPINSEILANSIPNAQLIRWKEGGHAMIYQYPNEIASRINHFIAETKVNVHAAGSI